MASEVRVIETNEKLRPNHITRDGKCFYISYVLDYEKIFVELNLSMNIYKTLETLIFEDCSTHELPNIISKFQSLTSLELKGSRFWNLLVAACPVSLKRLLLIDQTNLQSFCLCGMQNLVNLEEIYLTFEAFDFGCIFGIETKNDKNLVPIYPLVTLKIIRFYVGRSLDPTRLIKKWKLAFQNHVLFAAIKARISKVNLNMYEKFPIIQIVLKKL